MSLNLCSLIPLKADYVINKQMQVPRYGLEYYRTRLALNGADSSNNRRPLRSSNKSTLPLYNEMYSYSSIQELDHA
jgi:hypothetical protein